jgi:allophanate hydrolase subunit 2
MKEHRFDRVAVLMGGPSKEYPISMKSGTAMDAAALRRANGLLGQAAGLAGLEVTLEGLRVRFLRATRCAVTGADLEARLDGALVGTERVVDVVAGSTLTFGRARWG